jgi:3-keto-5-aminohexanoate cleavage enzyme
LPETWIEVALNGGLPRSRQPHVPVSIDEIVMEGIACAREGAAILHVHAYDPITGRQTQDADVYSRIIEGIRAQVDAIVYPTIDASTSPGSELSKVGPERYEAIAILAERGLLEWTVVDPGSVNLSTYRGLARERPGMVYVNTESDIRAGLALSVRHDVHPSYAIYEPGFLRLGAGLAALYPGMRSPIYRFMFSDDYAFGFPPRAYALEAYLQMLAEFAPQSPWMIAGLMVDVAPLFPLAVDRGGHIRTGLEDAPLGCERSNVAMTIDAVAAVQAAGGAPATAAKVREGLRRPVNSVVG